MKRDNYSALSTYALIACLGIALVLGQMFKIHMHIGHDDISSSVSTDHVFEIHVNTSVIHNDLHKSMHHSHHENDLDKDHHADEIDLSFGSLVKKSMSLNQFVFFFFIIGIVISVLLLSRFLRIRDFTSKQSSRYYLFQPPLRAPPIHSS